MLSRAHRLTSTLDYSRVVRLGKRVSCGGLVFHAVTNGDPARVGFVVSKAVGSAPVRNRVKRRLRALCSQQIARLSGDIVVRAKPSVASVSFESLAADFENCLKKLADGRA